MMDSCGGGSCSCKRLLARLGGISRLSSGMKARMRRLKT
jgi:hypothetical protein